MRELFKSIKAYFLSASFWVGVPAVVIWFISLKHTILFLHENNISVFISMIVIILHTIVWMSFSIWAFYSFDKFINWLKRK